MRINLIKALLFITVLILFSCAQTKPFEDIHGSIIKNSVACLKKIEINGIRMQVLIRGENVENPVLLFLHGGPGAPEMALTNYYYQKELEKTFIVAHYDQRGAGKSYSKSIPPETMNLDQIVEDTAELSRYLIKKFNKKKIVLIGHSWGTIVGMHCIKKYPELFEYYIGIGQAVNMYENEMLSYNYTLEKAYQINNINAIKELEKIGKPPYENYNDGKVQRKWLMKLGGSIYNGSSYSDFKEGKKLNDEYTLLDWFYYWLPGLKYSYSMLQSELNEVDLFVSVKKVNVPVYFFLGRYDYQTPSQIAERYFNHLEAPYKKIYRFEKSAHMIQFEEPENFIETIREINKCSP